MCRVHSDYHRSALPLLCTNLKETLTAFVLLLCRGWRVQREVLSALLPGGVMRATVLQVILAAEAIFALYMLLGTLMGGLSEKVFNDVLKLRGVTEVKPTHRP